MIHLLIEILFGYKNNHIIKFSGKFMALDKSHPDLSIPDPESICFIFTYMWILAIKSMITSYIL